MILAEVSFTQSLVLLVVTALLTGLVVPYVLKTVEYRKSTEQREREAASKRQAEIIAAQSKFLDELTTQLWGWRYMSMKVTYYGGTGSADEYASASQDYNAAVWDSLNQLRNQISRSRRLVSENAYQRLVSLYDLTLVALDKQLSQARFLEHDLERRGRFVELNHYIYESVTQDIDTILDELAAEMELKA